LHLRIEVGELLLVRLDVLLGAVDVLALLHDAPRPAGGGGGPAERRRAHGFPAEHRAEQRRAERDRDLHAGLRDLLGLTLDRLFRAADPLLKRRDLRRIFPTKLLELLVTLFAPGVSDARAKIRLALSRPRERLDPRAGQDVERAHAEEPRCEVLAPPV